jgi:hypothetical protein
MPCKRNHCKQSDQQNRCPDCDRGNPRYVSLSLLKVVRFLLKIILGCIAFHGSSVDQRR